MQTSADTSVSEVVLNMMKKRVLFKKEGGEQETPLDAYKRVAKYISIGHAVYETANEVKRFEEKATEMMHERKFMPNTPTLVNAGFPKAQCSACFVLPVEDNLPSLYKAHHDQGLIQASGGGTGFFLGNVRSAGTTAAGRFTTKGPLNWLRMLNENATHVAQGMREGANMAILNIDHPDIFDFITCKKSGYDLVIEDLMKQFNVDKDEAKRLKSIIGIEKFNISVSITDDFMAALDSYSSEWPLIDPHTHEVVRVVNPHELFELIIESAWLHGEPGLFFEDEANRFNSIPHIGRIRATNPCGEQTLLSNESCTLGHVNLSRFVVGMNGSSSVDWDGFEDAIRFGTIFLDNVVEVNSFPIPELAHMNAGTRRIGLGVMGWADMLAMMGIPYDSEEAIYKASEVSQFFDKISEDQCRKLGKDRGNFKFFEGSVFDGVEKHMRASDRTTVAPTGQTSMYAMCSSSIEPLIFPVIKREQAGMIQVDYHPALFDMLKKRDLDTSEVREKLGEIGSVRDADFLPEDIRQSFPSSHDIGWEWHVRHQAAWQKNITSAVSKTINMPNSATKDDIKNAYREAFSSGCKGITVYRDGSRSYQPLSSNKKEESKEQFVQIGHRDEVTHGSNRKVPNGCGNLMVYIGNGKTGIQEVTARLGKGGGCASAQTEAIARMASVAMQHGASPENVAQQLGGIRCHLTAMHKSPHTGARPRIVTSCGDAISVALSEHIAEMSGTEVVFNNASEHTGACPECGGQLSFLEGCRGGKCHSCGFSKC